MRFHIIGLLIGSGLKVSSIRVKEVSPRKNVQLLAGSIVIFVKGETHLMLCHHDLLHYVVYNSKVQVV